MGRLWLSSVNPGLGASRNGGKDDRNHSALRNSLASLRFASARLLLAKQREGLGGEVVAYPSAYFVNVNLR